MKTTLKICLLLVVWGIFDLPAVAQEKEMSKEELAFVLRVNDLLENNQAEEAYKQVNFGIEKYPKNAILYILRAVASTDLGTKTKQSIRDLPNEKYRWALADLNKAIELNGDLVTIYEIQARLYLIYQQYEQALEAYNSLYEASKRAKDDKTMRIAIFNRATVYQRLNRCEEAVRDLEDLVKNYPENLDYRNNLALRHLELKDYAKAHQVLDAGLVIEPKHYRLRQNKAFTYIQQGKHKDAIKILDQLIKETEKAKNGYYYSNHGEAKMGLGKFKDAMEDINKSLELYPENSYAFRNRGLLHLKMGKKDLACADFQTAEKYGFSLSYGDEVKELLKKHCK